MKELRKSFPNISYKLFAFADYTNISYTSENIMKAISAFKGFDFLANVISEMLADGNVSQRIQLRIASGGQSITILAKRIDIELSSRRKEGFSDEEKKSLQPEIYQMPSTVHQVFDEVISMANRVACRVIFCGYYADVDEASPEICLRKSVALYAPNMWLALRDTFANVTAASCFPFPFGVSSFRYMVSTSITGWELHCATV